MVVAVIAPATQVQIGGAVKGEGTVPCHGHVQVGKRNEGPARVVNRAPLTVKRPVPMEESPFPSPPKLRSNSPVFRTVPPPKVFGPVEDERAGTLLRERMSVSTVSRSDCSRPGGWR